MSALKPYHSGDYLRLRRLLRVGGRFQWIIVEHNFIDYAERIQAQLVAQNVRADLWRLPQDLAPEAFVSNLRDLSYNNPVVQIVDFSAWRQRHGDSVFSLMNYARERLAESVKVSVLLWLTREESMVFARQAPDLWAWRAAVLNFSLEVEATGGLALASPNVADIVEINNRDRAAKQQRLEELETFLRASDVSHAHIGLWLEMADIHLRLGQNETAEAAILRAQNLAEEHDDAWSQANAKSRLAKLLEMHGQLDEALRICQEEILPVYEGLGERLEIAITKGKIADIMQLRGQWDEALRIREQEQLPVYEGLGELRSIAIIKGHIADILQLRGQWDEALRIREQEQLPVYEDLGELRLIAITKGQIADILQLQGQWDEALRIREQEQLPVYEGLGELRLIAITKGQIAGILQARGQWDEALRIRQEEELPVYEGLGELRSIAITKGQIAEILQARGQLDEALRIREEEELPVFEALGDRQAILVAQAKLAMLLLEKGEPDTRPRAQSLLSEALAAARAMQLPHEAKQIATLMQQNGWPTTA